MSFQKGDPVEVLDPGLAMLRRFAPPGARPNHHGTVDRVEGDEVYVLFPIGSDDDEHSQSAPYPADMVRLRGGKRYDRLPLL